MSKRGQVSVFMILGIIILFVTVLIYFIIGSTADRFEEKEVALEEVITLEATSNSVKSYVEGCMVEVAEEAMFENSWTGGYFYLPEYATKDLFENLPYYFYLGENLAPTDDELASETASYVDVILKYCLDDFDIYEKYGYDVTYEDPSSKAILDENKLRITTSMPVMITFDAQIKTLNIFEAEVSSQDYYQGVEVARSVVNSTDGDGVCLTCFSNLASENEMFVGVIPYDEDIYIINVKDDSYELEGEEFHMMFAMKMPIQVEDEE